MSPDEVKNRLSKLIQRLEHGSGRSVDYTRIMEILAEVYDKKVHEEVFQDVRDHSLGELQLAYALCKQLNEASVGTVAKVNAKATVSSPKPRHKPAKNAQA